MPNRAVMRCGDHRSRSPCSTARRRRGDQLRDLRAVRAQLGRLICAPCATPLATAGSRDVTRHESPASSPREISSRSGSDRRYAAQASAMRTAFVPRPTKYAPG